MENGRKKEVIEIYCEWENGTRVAINVRIELEICSAVYS